MEQLRKAGRALQNFDTAYARRAERDFGGAHKAPLKSGLGGAPLNEISYDTKLAEGITEHLIGSAFVGTAMATNIGYRYGLPAAGLTLAGKGLLDLTAQFGNAADYQEPGQLSL